MTLQHLEQRLGEATGVSDDQLINIASEFRIGILDGCGPHFMCAAVCWPLASLLELYGVAGECVTTDISHLAGRMRTGTPPADHVWIRLRDGRALDPTADQFNGLLARLSDLPPVYLGKPLIIHKAIRALQARP